MANKWLVGSLHYEWGTRKFAAEICDGSEEKKFSVSTVEDAKQYALDTLVVTAENLLLERRLQKRLNLGGDKSKGFIHVWLDLKEYLEQLPSGEKPQEYHFRLKNFFCGFRRILRARKDLCWE